MLKLGLWEVEECSGLGRWFLEVAALSWLNGFSSKQVLVLEKKGHANRPPLLCQRQSMLFLRWSRPKKQQISDLPDRLRQNARFVLVRNRHPQSRSVCRKLVRLREVETPDVKTLGFVFIHTGISCRISAILAIISSITTTHIILTIMRRACAWTTVTIEHNIWVDVSLPLLQWNDILIYNIFLHRPRSLS